MSGWLDAGFVGNTGSPGSRFNGPYNAVDRSNEPMFNQGYLISEIALPQDGFGAGGRIDLLYGEDYLLAQSVGMETHQNGSAHWNPQYYGFAIPQAYVEVGGPRLSTKFGHFYSIVGYEGLPAVGNFFFSKSYSYQFAGPFTHWGALTTYKMTDRLQFQGGLTNGWNGLDRTTDRLGILAGAKYSADLWWTSFAITAGDEDNNPAGLPGVAPSFANRNRYSWLVGLTLTDRLDYVFHHWLGLQDRAWPTGRRPSGTASISTSPTRSTAAGRPGHASNGSATTTARASA